MIRCTPPSQRDPAAVQQEALVAVNQKLKAKEVCTSIIENAVASSSAVTLEDVLLEKLSPQEHIQTLMPEECEVYAEHQRQKRRRNWAAKKEAAKVAKKPLLDHLGIHEVEVPLLKEALKRVPHLVSRPQFVLFSAWEHLPNCPQNMHNCSKTLQTHLRLIR